MAKRTYRIEVPYTTTGSDGLAIMAGLGRADVQKALKRLDLALVAKLERCGPFHHETFSKAELDSVPDDIWAQLEPHLG